MVQGCAGPGSGRCVGMLASVLRRAAQHAVPAVVLQAGRPSILMSARYGLYSARHHLFTNSQVGGFLRPFIPCFGLGAGGDSLKRPGTAAVQATCCMLRPAARCRVSGAARPAYHDRKTPQCAVLFLQGKYVRGAAERVYQVFHWVHARCRQVLVNVYLMRQAASRC